MSKLRVCYTERSEVSDITTVLPSCSINMSGTPNSGASSSPPRYEERVVSKASLCDLPSLGGSDEVPLFGIPQGGIQKVGQSFLSSQIASSATGGLAMTHILNISEDQNIDFVLIVFGAACALHGYLTRTISLEREYEPALIE